MEASPTIGLVASPLVTSKNCYAPYFIKIHEYEYENEVRLVTVDPNKATSIEVANVPAEKWIIEIIIPRHLPIVARRHSFVTNSLVVASVLDGEAKHVSGIKNDENVIQNLYEPTRN